MTRAGRSYASIDTTVTEELTRDQVIQAMADAAGVDRRWTFAKRAARNSEMTITRAG